MLHTCSVPLIKGIHKAVDMTLYYVAKNNIIAMFLHTSQAHEAEAAGSYAVMQKHARTSFLLNSIGVVSGLFTSHCIECIL